MPTGESFEWLRGFGGAPAIPPTPTLPTRGREKDYFSLPLVGRAGVRGVGALGQLRVAPTRCASDAAMNSSKFPSSTAAGLPVSTSVRKSFTI